MTITTTGPVDFYAIGQEFGLNSAISLSDLYGKANNVPVSGAITLSNFYGKRNVTPTLTTLANDLGGSGMGPWGGVYSDTSARFIWNSAGAASSAPPGWVSFQATYYNNTNTAINGTIDLACDNLGKIYINKSIVNVGYGGWGATSKCNCTLPSGSNIIDITCQNAGSSGNPAMVCYFIQDSGNNVIMRSDNVSVVPLTNTTKTFCSTTTVATEPVIS
jgi:hypothetical protein